MVATESLHALVKRDKGRIGKNKGDSLKWQMKKYIYRAAVLWDPDDASSQS